MEKKMLYFLGLLLVAQSCLGESGHSSFFGARVGRGKRRGSQDESPGERNTAVVKSRSIGRTRLPPGVVIRPGVSMGINTLGFPKYLNSTGGAQEGLLEAMGLPFNKQLISAIGEGLVPKGETMDAIEEKVSDLLFGQKLEEEDIGSKASGSSPVEQNKRRKWRKQKVKEVSASNENLTTPGGTFNTSILSGDRGPAYEDYDYKDYDMYSTERKSNAATADSSNNDEEINEDNNENAFKSSIMTPVASERMQLPWRGRQPGHRHPQSRPLPGGPFVGPLLPGAANSPNGKVIVGRQRPYIPLRGASSTIQRRLPTFRQGGSGKRSLGRHRGTAKNFISDEFAFPDEAFPDNLHRLNKKPFFPSQEGPDPFESSARRPRRRPPGDESAEESDDLDGSDDEDCDFYTQNICLDVQDYPSEKILSLLNRNRRVGSDLVADVVDQSADSLIDGVSSAQESKYTFSHYYGENRRQGSAHRDFANEGGFLCPSEIMYAKPKRGKTAQGEWKDIVNVKDYTQTLRMEKCLKPGGGCSYVSHHYKSQCSQVYNYHRLLSWSEKRGLHMDIYKVPACCSCHIMGYSYVYPPLNKKDVPSVEFYSDEHEDSFDRGIEFSHDNYEYDDEDFVTSTSVEEFASSVSGFSSPMGANKDEDSEDPFAAKAEENFKNFVSSITPSFSPGEQPLITSPQVSLGPPSRPRRPPPGPPVPLRSKRPVRGPRPALPRRRMDEGKPDVFRPPQPSKLSQRHHPGRRPSESVPHHMRRRPPTNRKPVQRSNARNQSAKTTEAEAKGEDASSEAEAKEKLTEELEETEQSSEDDKTKSVNYGYHPIIDFFDRYRWSAA